MSMSKRNHSVTIDIGSSRVVGSWVSKDNNKLRILHTCYKDIPFQETLSTDRYTELMFQTLNDCLDDLVRVIDNNRPTSVLCTLSSIMYDSELKSTNRTFKEETRITRAHIDALHNDNLAGDSDGSMILDHATIRIMLNGYPTTNPIGKYAHVINASTYMSHGDGLIFDKIRTAIRSRFHSVEPTIHSFSFAVFTILRDIMHEENFIALDFGGEITDIVVVRGTVMDKTISIPFGRNVILRQMMKSMNVSMQIAESTLRLYNEGNLEQSKQSQVSEALASCKQRWDTLFLGTLENVTLVSLLPQTVHVMAEQYVMPIISSYIESDRYGKYVFVAEPFKVHRLNADALQSLYTVAKKDIRVEPVVVISAMFSDRIEMT